MNIQKRLLVLGALSLSLLATGALAKEDKATKQAEVVTKTEAAMERFYKVKPELKDAVAKAPGYGIFTTYGVSFVIGGSGGSGRRARQQDQAQHLHEGRRRQRGPSARCAQTEVLFIFKSAAAMNKFIDQRLDGRRFCHRFGGCQRFDGRRRQGRNRRKRRRPTSTR